MRLQRDYIIRDNDRDRFAGDVIASLLGENPDYTRPVGIGALCIRAERRDEAFEAQFFTVADDPKPKWTREKPTEPGWYWLRYDLGLSGTITDVERVMEHADGGGLAIMNSAGHFCPLDRWADCEWQGPIRPEEAADGKVG